MAKRLIFLSVFLISFAPLIRAQPKADTLVVYDVATQSTVSILPIAFNTLLTSDNTSSSVGNLGNVFPLSQTPPTTNLFTGSNFSALAYASNFFNLTDYPVRTVVSVQNSLANDSVVRKCTGMIVGPCFVMTGAINVYNFLNKSFFPFDSIRIFPAFNNGQPQVVLPGTSVKKIYIFKSFYSQTHWDDIALLELKDPIGLQTGWTGIGFNSNTNFTSGKTYHKFSYPSGSPINDSSKVYNGDTLYYNYGSILDQGQYLTVNSAQAVGISGQGGSTFLYRDSADYYSLGLLSFSNNYTHYRITNSAFYQMKNVLDNSACAAGAVSLKEFSKETLRLKFSPNPFSTEATLDFDYDPSVHYSITIVNSLGQQIRKATPVTNGHVKVSREQMAAGIYFLQLSSNEGASTTCKMVVE